MDPFIANMFVETACPDSPASFGIERCPYLKNINEPTDFAFSSSSTNMCVPVRGIRGPIFIDGPQFDNAFRLFHGRDGVVPLTGRSFKHTDNLNLDSSQQFDPLAAKAATISLSGFGPGGPFGFDSFSQNWKRSNNKKTKRSGDNSNHESPANEWFQTGQCPIAKSYRAVSGVLPLVSKVIRPPPGVILRCPPAVVAVRAALAKTALVKNLRPQSLSVKMLSIGLLGMAANIPLGIWREHTVKFSPQWFLAIHAAVPFIAMLRKSVNMPKAAMVFTIAASILGQTVGSRAERIRMKAIENARNAGVMADKRNYVDLVEGPGEKIRQRCKDESAFDLTSNKSDFHGMGTVGKRSGICC
ncbi:zinc finger B-box protein [Rhynchospora pubera]|uniref:Zinc finger B-box protein n=1 Tax=Rhynchospora pubera TaxID=906938 RepID=A0AAV8CUG5_9POAL|nr:zinc finger B-box protein [Rhynchospora pubera]KAJ4811478.1 zinc finger B-box protein [Rhynchospora pubera]